MTDTLALLAFLLWGNLLPPLTSMALGDRFARPLDSGPGLCPGAGGCLQHLPGPFAQSLQRGGPAGG